MNNLEKKLIEAEMAIEDSKKKIDRICHRILYWKEKCSTIQKLSDEKELELEAHREGEYLFLLEEIADLEQKNSELRDTVEELVSDKDISAYQNGKYTDDVRACCYELLSLNVGIRNISAVITSVLKTLLTNLLIACPVIQLYVI